MTLIELPPPPYTTEGQYYLREKERMIKLKLDQLPDISPESISQLTDDRLDEMVNWVMGKGCGHYEWKRTDFQPDDPHKIMWECLGCGVIDTNCGEIPRSYQPGYSSPDSGAAWGVLNEFMENFYTWTLTANLQIEVEPYAALVFYIPCQNFTTLGDSFPEAICKAAVTIGAARSVEALFYWGWE